MAIDRQQPERHGTAAVRYRSLHCHIGTHGECDETEPADPPLALPVIYETCGCSCHQPADQGRFGGEVR